MFNIAIEDFRLTFHNAQGHEHRIAPIAERAMALVAEGADERWRVTAVRPQQQTSVNLDLASTGDEQAARTIADLCLEALALRL